MGKVIDKEKCIIRGVVNQLQAQLINESPEAVEIRVKGRPTQIHRGELIKTLPVGVEVLPSVALGYSAGGEVQTRQDDSSGRKTSEKFFEVTIKPEIREGLELLPGQVLVVRCDLEPKAIGYQLWRTLRQEFLKRFRVL